MDQDALYAPVKWVAVLILLLIVVSLVYAAYVSMAHWTGIGV
jgi:hypothetical protein